MIVPVILTVCSAPLLSQLECVMRLDQDEVLAGDILYLEVSFKNITQEKLLVSPPTASINYELSIKYGNTEQGYWAGENYGGTGKPVVLSPNESVSQQVLVAPWHVFTNPSFIRFPKQEAAFSADGLSEPIIVSLSSGTNTSVHRKVDRQDGWLRVETKFFPADDVRIKFCESVCQIDLDRNIYRFHVTGPEPDKELEKYWPVISKHRGRSRDRMSLLGPMNFDLPLAWRYYEHSEAVQLMDKLRPESNIYRITRLIQMCNQWVNTDGVARTELEKKLLAFAAEGRPIEAKYLTAKLNRIFASKQYELGEFHTQDR